MGKIEIVFKVVLIAFLVSIFLLIKKEVHGSERYGYLVAVSTSTKPRIKKTENFQVVQNMVDIYGVDSKRLLTGRNVFDIKAGTLNIYVERKKIVVKKNGKVKYRRIKR